MTTRGNIEVIGMAQISGVDIPPDPLRLTMVSLGQRFHVRIQQAGPRNWFVYVSNTEGERIATPVAAYEAQETALEVAMLFVQHLAAGVHPSRLSRTGSLLE